MAVDNANFAAAITRLNLRWNGTQVEANWLGDETRVLLRLIFGPKVCGALNVVGGRVSFVDPRGNAPYPRARPLAYNIGKNTGGIRQVALMHPRSQIAVAQFYETYADTILYFTNRSRYSIRHPVERARFTVHRDPVFAEDVDEEATGVEETEREYDSIRSFFTYSKFSHIYKFHESAEFRHLERSYGRLVHADVTRCFDSIYTHSISWVTNGLEVSKERTRETLRTFGGRFDKLMQASNDLETHGILIGPELSRIFAEIILQEVDVRVERSLAAQGLRLGVQYEIRRFVDDYFIFCSSEEDGNRIVSALGDELKSFKLYLNESKRVDEVTPLRSARSVAKHQLAEAFRSEISVAVIEPEDATPPTPRGSTERLLLAYKGVILSSQLEHADLANYALIRLEFEFERALARWAANSRSSQIELVTEKSWSSVVRFILSIVDVAVSIYAGGVSASHSVKVSRIAHTALRFMEETGVPYALKRGAQSRIASEIGTHVRRGDSDITAPMHALILLDSLASMEGRGRVGEAQVRALVGLGPQVAAKPDALAILTALRYCGGREDLRALRLDLEMAALEALAVKRDSLDTNATLLAAGLLSSPFASKSVRKRTLDELGLAGTPLPPRSQSALFFHWDVSDYYRALQQKRGGEVY